MELKSIMIKDNDWEHCFWCGKPMHQIHHVMHGTKSNKKKSEKYGLLVPLCYICHSQVHDNSKEFKTLYDENLDRKLKEIAQADFMLHHSYALWMKEFGKNYM